MLMVFVFAFAVFLNNGEFRILLQVIIQHMYVKFGINSYSYGMCILSKNSKYLLAEWRFHINKTHILVSFKSIRMVLGQGV